MTSPRAGVLHAKADADLSTLLFCGEVLMVIGMDKRLGDGDPPCEQSSFKFLRNDNAECAGVLDSCSDSKMISPQFSLSLPNLKFRTTCSPCLAF